MTIDILCYLNFLFVIEHVILMVFINKIRRQYEFPNILHLTDLVCAVCSYNMISFIRSSLFSDIPSTVSEREQSMRFMANLFDRTDFPLEYTFALISLSLIVRSGVNLQFIESIGPLIKILSKMSMDFLNFVIIYCILVFMFALLGNINYHLQLAQFKGFNTSIFTVIDTSIGIYDLKSFDTVDSEFYRIIG